MPPETSVQSEHNNTSQSIILQEARDELSSLLEGVYNSTVSKSSMNVVRRNLFQVDIQTAELPNACKL